MRVARETLLRIAMDTKLTVKEIEEMLVEYEGGTRKNICVPNVSFSMLNHEADLIVVKKSHYATEFEIKRSYEDFVADFAKKHKHEAEWIYRFIYVLPLSIKDKAMKFLEDTGRKGSVCIWFYSEEPWIAEKTGIPHNPKGRKMYLEELLKLARLGVMRYWNLRMKDNDEIKEKAMNKISLEKEFEN